MSELKLMDETKSFIEVEDVDGKTAYTLGFNRAVVKSMESQGFDARELDTKPNTMMEILIINAFKWKQPKMTPVQCLDAWATFDDPQDLLMELVKLYSVPANALIANPTGEATSRMKWRLV